MRRHVIVGVINISTDVDKLYDMIQICPMQAGRRADRSSKAAPAKRGRLGDAPLPYLMFPII